MTWAERPVRLAGLALLFLAAMVIIDAVLETVVAGDANQLARGDVEGLLRDINDNETLFYIGNAFGIVADSAALLAVAALLYLLVRERSQALAIFFFAGLVAASVCFLIADAASAVTGVLAADFVEKGGPGDIGAGDSATLQSARATAAFWALADFTGLTALSLGLFSLGALLLAAPEAEINPPRWLGGLLMASSTALLLTWLFLAQEDAGFTLSGIGIIGTLLFIVILAGWLLTRPTGQTEMAATRSAAANV